MVTMKQNNKMAAIGKLIGTLTTSQMYLTKHMMASRLNFSHLMNFSISVPPRVRPHPEREPANEH